MVRLTTYMVAVTAMMMGIQCLDQASAKDIESKLVASKVIPSDSNAVHADGLAEDLENFISALPISFSPLPQITDTPDNSINFVIPNISIVKAPASVSGAAPSVAKASAPAPSVAKVPAAAPSVVKIPAPAISIVKVPAPAPSVAPKKGNGKRAVFEMDDEPSSSVAAAAVHSASASHAHSSSSVKAVLRARGMRGAGFRAAQFRSKVAEEHSASQSASASVAEASHLARRGEASASASYDADEAAITQAAIDLNDIAKIGEAILGREVAASLSKLISKELVSHATDIAAIKSFLKNASSIKLPKPTPTN